MDSQDEIAQQQREHLRLLRERRKSALEKKRQKERAQQLEREQMLTVELMTKLEHFDQPIPDALVDRLLQSVGCQCPDPKVRALVALAAQRFLSSIFKSSRRGAVADGNFDDTLDIQHLCTALQKAGVEVVQPPYLTDDQT